MVYKKNCGLLLLFFLISGFAYSQVMPSKADKQYEMGMYDLAATTYESEIDQNPKKDVDKYIKLAACHENMNEPTKAIQVYEQAGMIFDLPKEAYIRWAQSLKKIGHEAEAEQLLDIAGMKGILDKDESVRHTTTASLQYEVRPMAFNSDQNEFSPTYFRESLVYVSDAKMGKKTIKASTTETSIASYLVKYDFSTGSQEMLRGKLKDYLNDGPCCYSEDKSIICYSKAQFSASQSPKLGNKKSGTIFIAETDSEGDWLEPVSLPCNELGVANIYPHIDKSAEVVYFASNRAGGYGGFDLYKTKRMGDGWSTPQNLGSAINSDSDEISPYLNGDKLFFASNRSEGYGGFDLYTSNLKSKNAPSNLGAGINSSWDDYTLITKDRGDTGYFTSNRPTKYAGENIFSFKKSSEIIASTSTKAASANQPIKSTASAKLPESKNYKPVTVSNQAASKPNKLTATNQADARKSIFTIQIAAVSNIGSKFDEMKSTLSDIGEVYKVFYHNVIKIRVGQFTSDLTARTKLESVKKRGYKDAFIVKEELIQEELLKSSTTTVTSESSVAKTSYSNTTIAIEEKPSTVVEKTENKTELPAFIPQKVYDERLTDLPKYRIKLGSYTNLAHFDGTEIKKFGTVVTEEKDEWTMVYLGDYMSIEDAEAIRVEATKRGFSAACIYGVRNGELIKIN